MESFRSSKCHRFTRLWHIRRGDGTSFYFTDFQYNIEHEGHTYTPVTVTSVSAIQRQEGLAERNRSFLGHLSSSAFTEDDLRAKLFNDAEVFERQVDWKYPWQGVFVFNTYRITEIKWTGEVWEAELDMLTTRLRQYKGHTVSRRCRWPRVGSTDCGVNMTPYEESGSVSSVVTQRRVMQTGLTTQPDNYYRDGWITFTSGENEGLEYKIYSSTQTGGVITLIFPTKYDVSASDTFTITPGCNGTESDCKGNNDRPWANNFLNFGGFPHVPGNTAALSTP